jgi:hypothetical protein
MTPASETLIQVHLEERTKYFAQRFARSSGLTLGTFVNNCVDAVLSLTEVTSGTRTFTFEQVEELLWSDDPVERFLKVAVHFPNMLTERERILWKAVICKDETFWKVPITTWPPPQADKHTFRSDVLHTHWEEFESMDRDALLIRAQAMREVWDATRDAAMSPEQAEFKEQLRATLAKQRKQATEQLGNL